MRMVTYLQKIPQYHNVRIHGKFFKAGDLVPRQAEVSQPTNQGKLYPKWEGPYRVEEVNQPGTYRQTWLDGIPLPHPWNSENLRTYYQ